MYRTLIVLTLLIPAISRSQYVFTTLQTQDGLSSKAVNCVLKDSDGFLWFGTENGLNRFDGSSFKVYNWANHNYPFDQNEIIRAIVEIRKGVLLIGTRTGLMRFSPYTKEFDRVPVMEGSGLDQEFEVYDIVVDPNNMVWITSSSGLLACKSDTVMSAGQVFKEIAVLESEVASGGLIILDTLRRGIWVNSDAGMFFVDYTTGKITTVGNPVKPLFNEGYIYAMAVQPSTGDVWWSDPQNLLARYRLHDRVIENLDSLVDQRQIARSLFFDSRERLWYSTWSGTMFVRETDGSMHAVPSKSTSLLGLYSGFVNDYTEEGNGDIWFATMGGVAKLAGSNVIRSVINLPGQHSAIHALHRLTDGRILIGSGAGLFRYEEEGRNLNALRVFSEGTLANRVFTISEINGELWCGTGAGVHILSAGPGGSIQPELPPFTEEIKNHSVNSLMQDSRGQIWIIAGGGDVYKYDPVLRNCTRFDGTESGHGDIGKKNCTAIIEDGRQRIWIGYGDQGIRVNVNPSNGFQKFTVDPILESCVISGFAENTLQQMWVSTWGDGLFLLGTQGEVLSHFTTQQGLSSNYTSGVSIDKEGRVWFATPESVHYLDTTSSIVNKLNFDSETSLGEDWVTMLHEDHTTLVTLKYRILLIDRTMLGHAEKPALPLITAIKVFEEEQRFTPVEPDLHLNYDQNFFRIDFSSPQHLEFPSLKYAYFLEGFNRDWTYCDRQLSAGFTNVPPGEYVFRVKSSDRNGKFYGEHLQFGVIVTPPFWKTTAFYLLYAVVSGYVLFLLYRFIQRRKLRKQSDQIIDYFANSAYGENSVNEICWDIARNCISQLGFLDCIVYLMDTDRNVLVQTAAFGPKSPKGYGKMNPYEIPVGEGIIGAVAASGRALLIPDTSKDVRYIKVDNVSLSELTVPIIHDQKVIGIIDSEHPDKHFFTEEHLKTLLTIASISSFKIAEAQAQMLARENELKLLELNTLFAESQLKALRAQMNPHFVFNCLNSIQECIVTKKYAEASAYLNKFAKLFRLVLNNSGKMLITIDEEVEILTLYLELELMRFDRSFTYHISVDPALESDDILMPSMFLQPFVENALWHGLMHKTGDRRLDVSFKKLSEDVFACTVEDNGIGRKASAEFRKQRVFGQSYDSKGMKMNLERLEVLRRQGFHTALDIIDKEDPDGTPLGTSVVTEFSNNLSYQ